MVYTKDVQDAVASGYSLEQVRDFAISEAQGALDAGFSRKDVEADLKKTYGLSTGVTIEDIDDATFLKNLMFQDQGPSEKKASSMSEALSAGFGNSVAGLLLNGQTSEFVVDDNSDFWYKALSGAAQMAGDIPAMVVGGLVGTPAGGAAGTTVAGPAGGVIGAVVGGGYGAGFAAGYIREALIQSYQKGECVDWIDFSKRVINNFQAGNMEGMVGAIAGGAAKPVSVGAQALAAPIKNKLLSETAQKSAELIGETSVLTTAMAALNGKMPTAEDFVLNAVTIGGFKTANGYVKNIATNIYTDKFMDVFKKTGATPDQVVKASIVDPTVKERILSINTTVEAAERKKTRTGYYQVPETVIKGYEAGDTYDAIEFMKRMQEESGGSWLLLSELEASKGKTTRVAKTGETIPTVVPIDVSTTAPMIRIQSGKTEQIRPFAERYFETPEGQAEIMDRFPLDKQRLQAGDKNIFTSVVKDLFNNPSEEFINFLRTSQYTEKELNALFSNRGPESVVSRRQLTPSGERVAPDGTKTPVYSMGWRGILRTSGKGQQSMYVFKDTARIAGGQKAAPSPEAEASARLREHVSIGDKTTHTWSERVNSLMYHLVDSFHALDFGAERGKHTEAYKWAILSNGAEGKATGMIRHWQTDYAGNTIGRSLNDIVKTALDNGGTAEGLSEYLSAKFFDEQRRAGKGTVISDADINSILSGKNAGVYELVAKELRKFYGNLLQYQKDAGLITQSKLNEFNARHPEAFDLKFLVEAYETALKDDVGRILGPAKAGEAAKTYQDPLESITKATYLTVKLAEQNRVKFEAAQLFGSEHTVPEGSPKATTLSYYVEGKRINVAVPEEIAKACERMDTGTLRSYNAALQGIAKVTGWFRTATTGTPVFALKNLLVDQLTAMIQSPKDVHYIPYAGAVDGLISMLKTKWTGKPSAYTDWMQSGGSQSSMFALGRDSLQRNIKDIQRVPVINMIKDPLRYHAELVQLLNPLNMDANVLGRAWRAVEGFTEASDIATRVGQFKAAKRAGYTDSDAAFISRMGTVDFARSGATIRGLNSIVAFLNARVQGVARLTETIKADPFTFLSRSIEGVVVPSFLLGLVRNDIIARNQNEDDPHYDLAQSLREVPDWMHAAYWQVPIPSMHTFINIPKPQELAILAAGTAESVVDWMFANDKDNSLTYLDQLAENGITKGIYDTMLPNVIPTPALGPIELMTNYSFFTGNTIIPSHLMNSVPPLQYKAGTTEVAKQISRTIFNLCPEITDGPIARFASPIGIDHLVRSWGGSMGQAAVQLLDTFVRAHNPDAPVRPEKSIEDYPFFHTFMAKYPSVNAKSISKFTEEMKELQSRYNAIKQGYQSGDPRDRAIADKLASSTTFANVTKLQQTMGTMSQYVNLINAANNDPVSKRQQIEQVYTQMIYVAREGRKLYRQLKQEMGDAGR